MTYDEVVAFDPERAGDLPPALGALVLDRAGRWDAAHRHAAEHEGVETNRVHAYLHRKEGDLAHAGYWYRRVGEPMPQQTLDDEWSGLVRRFLTS